MGSSTHGGPPGAGRLLVLAALVSTGCATAGDGGSDGDMGPPETGSIRVTTSTSGAELDSDGYMLSAGSNTRSIGVNATVTFADLDAASYTVDLTGVQFNCQVGGQNPRTLSVQAGATAETTFDVGCQPTGFLEVTTATTGADLDADGYRLTAGSVVQTVTSNGSATVGRFVVGPVDVELGQVASNCLVGGSNPRTVTILAGATAATTFPVTCSAAIWAAKPDMPTARLGLATAVVGGVVYAIGGYDASNAPGLTTNEAYDPTTETWSTKAPMPTGRRWVSAEVVNGRIYVIGGHTGVGAPGLSTVEEYDPAGDSWATKAPMPTARLALSTAVLNGEIYVVGGTPDNTAVLATVEAYDPATDTWATKASLPLERALVALETAGGMLYAIGGGLNPASGGSSVDMYDPATDTWTAGTNMPTGRSALCGGVVNGKIYVIGGANNGPSGTVYGATEEYDPSTDTWTTRADMGIPRAGLSCEALNGNIYAIGGVLSWVQPHPGVQTIEEFDPSIP